MIDSASLDYASKATRDLAMDPSLYPGVGGTLDVVFVLSTRTDAATYTATAEAVRDATMDAASAEWRAENRKNRNAG